MAYQVTQFESTPNPNARKALLDRPVCVGTRSYFSADQAADDPLARALFDVTGVQTVMMLGEFITINKAPGASWPAVERAVRAVLAESTEG